MPAMLRTNKKATKIARKIMGTPPAFRDTPSEKQQKVDRRLNFEETIKVR